MTIDRFNYYSRGASLLGVSGKPRSAAEWKERFASWQNAESQTESARIERAERSIREVLAETKNDFLIANKWRLIPQGSWHNRTNIRANSDFDICLCLTEQFHFNVIGGALPSLSEIGMYPLSFTFQEFKQHVFTALRQDFKNIAPEKKSLKLSDVGGNLSIDIVPTFTFRLYQKEPSGRFSVFSEGVSLETASGEILNNFPIQHNVNNKHYHEETGRRFRKVVRILKRLRNHIIENPNVPISKRTNAEGVASFVIESLVYNCPKTCFDHSEIYDNVVDVLKYLDMSLGLNGLISEVSRHGKLLEVNELKYIFGSHQKTTREVARQFVENCRLYMSC